MRISHLVTRISLDGNLTFRVEYNTPVGREMERLLKIPILSFNDILTVLSLENFRPLLEMFDFDGRRQMSVFIVNNVIDNETTIGSPEQVRACRRLSRAPFTNFRPFRLRLSWLS